MIKTAFIIINTNCNLKCPYCFYITDPSKHKNKRINKENFSKILNLLDQLKIEEICFTGGEPLLNNDLIDFIIQSNIKKFTTSLITNGTYLNLEKAYELLVSGLKIIFISLDDIDSTIHNYIRGQQERTLNAIQNVKKVGIPSIYINCVLTQLNSSNIDNIALFAKKQGVDISFQPAFIPSTDQSFKSFSLTNIKNEKFKSFLRQLEKWAYDNDRLNYFKLIESFYSINDLKPRNCNMGKDTIVIDSDANVYPCFHRFDLSAGNIFQMDNEKISMNLSKLYDKTKDANCFGEHCLSLFNLPNSELRLITRNNKF